MKKRDPADPLNRTGVLSPDLDARQRTAAVARVWRRLLGARAYRADTPWDAAGGDKLGMLRLAHGIERRLGRRVPLATMTDGMRPSEFTQRLIAQIGPPEPQSGKAPVVIFPGVRGDDPNLVAFRRTLGDDLDPIVVTYPRWESLVQPGASIGTVVDHVVGQIEREASAQPIVMIAYSVGGLVAHEAARRLAARGRIIAFVGLIDSFVSCRVRIGLPFDRPPGKPTVRPWSMRIGYRLARTLHRWPTLERLAARLRGRLSLPPDVAFYLGHYMTLWVMTVHALAWNPLIASVPITLFRGRLHAQHIPADLGWREFATDLTIEHVDGNHFSVIGGTHSQALARTIRASIDARVFDPRGQSRSA